MDKEEHAARLRAAMGDQGKSNTEVADYAGVKTRTVTNWRSGSTMPSDTERASLRRLLGPYDMPGDPVEIAIQRSRLTEDRQLEVRGYYRRKIREQDEETEGRRGA